MTRIPQVTARDLVRFLRSQGFIEDRQSGSHLTLWNPERKVAATIPIHTGADVGRGLAESKALSQIPAAFLRRAFSGEL